MAADLPLLFLALSAAVPAAVGGRAASPPCDLRISATPARLEAREDRRVLLRVATPGKPRLESSVGRVEDLRRGPDGSWSATLVAPPVSIPRVAIVTALAGDACGFSAIPLHGAGDALVRTRPGAVVDVQIAGRTFGPGQAGRNGVALIPVEVPPGVYSAWHGSQVIPLGLPRVRHVAVHLEESEVPADRDVQVDVLVVAVEDDGEPRASPRPAAKVSAGSLSPLVAAGAGAYRATWRLPAGRAGKATLEARLPGEEPATATLALAPGAPATLAATLDRTRVVAGAPDPVRLEVALTDAAGNPSDGPVAVEAGGLSVSPPTRTRAGVYQASLAVPQRLPGNGRVEIVARSGSLSAPVELALEPGPPARVEVAPDEGVLTADGHRGTTVRVRIADAHGNPVDVPPDRIEVSEGETGPMVPNGPGAYSFRYVPPRSRSPGAGEIEVAVGEETARTVLRLRPRLAPLSLLATAGLALRPGGGGPGLHAGAATVHWRWIGGIEAGLALSAGWSVFRDEDEVATGSGPSAFRGEVRELVLLLSPAWRVRMGGASSLVISAGAGAARVTSLVSLGGSPSIPEVGWAPSAGGAVTFTHRAGPGLALAELRAAWVKDPGLDSLDRSLSPISLSVGYLFHAL